MKKQELVLLVSLCIVLSAVAQQDTLKPEARGRAHLIFHPSSNAMLLFDGYVNHPGSTQNDVWKWDGERWSKILAHGPGSRIMNAAALHNKTGDIVFFAGWGKNAIEDKKSDCWSFNGFAWQKLNADTIGTRDHHKMTYADHLDAFIVYGGFDFNFKNDTVTWLLKDNRFLAIPGKGPGPRGNFGLTYDPHRKKIVLYGGDFSNKDEPADLWEFDGRRWEEINVPDIGITATYGMVYASDLKMSIVQNWKGETWGWDGKQMKKIAGNGPTEFGVALGYDPVRKVIVAYGGYGPQRTAVSALWELKNGAWKKVSDNGVWKQVSRNKYERLDPSVDITVPEARWAHHMTYDDANNRVLLYGGSHGAKILGDLWAWNGLSWEELTLGGPPARSKGIFVYDAIRKKAVLFGGTNSEDKNISDTWEWDGRDWNEIKVKGPSARVHGLGVFDETSKVVLIFGGFGLTGALNDTWAFDGKEWKQMNTMGPENRLPNGMMYDRIRKTVIMVTVMLKPDPTTGKQKNEMWEWKDMGWRKIPIAVPPFTGLQSFSSFRGDLIIFDGTGERGAKGTTWKYSGGKWQVGNQQGPGIRMGQVMINDKKRTKIVLFGGGKANSNERYNDTWEWDGNEWKKMK